MKPFPIPVDIVVAVIAAGLGFWYGRRLLARGMRFDATANAKQFPLIAGLGLVFVFGNTIVLWVLQHPAFSWYLPLPVDYYCVPIGWAADAALAAFLFMAVATLAGSRRRVTAVVLVAAGLVVVASGEHILRHNPYFTPVELGPPNITADGVILQTTASTCGAASCANIARHYGIESSEREMVELLGTTEHGTTDAQMVYGMRSLGFQCVKRRVPDADFAQLRGPAILLVPFGTDPLGHAVAYMGTDGDKAEIWNPQGGKRLVTREQLRGTWQGHAIEILPGDGQGE
jgi:Peptidase C39 family